jgi:RNA ligase
MQATFTQEQKLELLELVESGAASVKKHPTEDLYLYSYTRDYVRTPDENRWKNKLLNQCRGLILDGKGAVVARPFPKFFNFEELTKYYEQGEFEAMIAGKTPEFREKIDGSLGILYWKRDGSPALCTRNSWVSEQAVKGTELLNTKYGHLVSKLRRDRTYLFEIVYPENRLIVDYGDSEALYLLAVIDTATGREYRIDLDDPVGANPGFPTPALYDCGDDWTRCREVFENTKNREGLVVRFFDDEGNSVRVKMKFREYFELNFLKGKVTKDNLLKILCSQQADEKLRELRDGALQEGCEEIAIQLDRIAKDLKSKWYAIAGKIIEAWKPLGEFESKLHWATYLQNTGYSKVLFACSKETRPQLEDLENSRVARLIWCMVAEQEKENNEQD